MATASPAIHHRHTDPPLRETELRFTVGCVELAGTLALPAADPTAAVLLLPGSGEVDRDSNHRKIPLGVTRDLAHALARQGVASLRYDKRGIGASGGDFLSTGFHDNTVDAEAALEALTRSVAQVPLFVIGHSEGAMHAALLAGAHPELAGAVLLAAPGVPGEETLLWQGVQITGGLPPFTKRLLKLFRIDILAQQRKTIAKIKSTTTDVARIQLQKANAKWQREFLAYDPHDDLRRIDVPVLAITGGKDIQANPDDLEVIKQSIPAPVETQRPGNLTHLLRNDEKDPSIAAYKRLAKQPTDPELLRTVGDWIVGRAVA